MTEYMQPIKIVPLEPTSEMLTAGFGAVNALFGEATAIAMYRAMLAAAPPASAPQNNR